MLESSAGSAGINNLPSTACLESAIPELECQLAIQSFAATSRGPSTMRRSLAPRVGRREGDLLCTIKSLLFSSAECATAFLNAGGNAALNEGPVFRVAGLEKDDGSLSSIFALPVGVGCLLRDYRGIRSVANVSIVAKPEMGSNDGFLEVRVCTHNGCGAEQR